MKLGIEIIADERRRQIMEEGYTSEKDDQRVEGELADAGASYALSQDTKDYMKATHGEGLFNHIWPWTKKSYKPTPQNRVKELAKAGALIAAEIDRINRALELKKMEEANTAG